MTHHSGSPDRYTEGLGALQALLKKAQEEDELVSSIEQHDDSEE